jgi:hypothetical protein
MMPKMMIWMFTTIVTNSLVDALRMTIMMEMTTIQL